MDQEKNTFSEGVAPGGLRTAPEIKLLICYLLKALRQPLSRSQINEIMQEYPVANYFEVNQALSELVKNGSVLSELSGETEELTLPGKLMFDVETIERSLPRSVREKAMSAALQVLARERVKRESRTEITKLAQGFHVKFTISDMGTELLELKVYVTDEAQIETVKRNFYANAVAIYSDIISALTVE